MINKISYSSLLGLFLFIQVTSQAGVIDVYFSTRNKGAEGIYRSTLDTSSGKLTTPEPATSTDPTGFLICHPKTNELYAVTSNDTEHSVKRFQAAEDGSLTELQSVKMEAGGAAHLAIHPDGKLLITAHYGSGKVSVFGLSEDGTLTECLQIIEHGEPSGVNEKRQNAPHPHWTGFSPDGRYAFVPDLGMDKIIIYQVQLDPVQFVPNGAAESDPGSGPRHMKFSLDGKQIYLLNELNLTVSVFDYDSGTGAAQMASQIETLSEEVKSKESMVTASEIQIHPSGRFLYTANRGHDSISAFRIDPSSKKLSLIEVEAIRGAWPRHFAIDPTGKWLLVAGARSDSISVFAIDPESGELQFQARSIVHTPDPICVLFRQQQ
ncbi:MAG: lactonase family protein [Verrucomicrobiota bacterium]